MERGKCHDCGVLEGQIHKYGCDMEKCPFCDHQLIACGCCYEHLGLVDTGKFPQTDGLSLKIYNEGLTQELENEWIRILESKGRISYIRYPVMCCKCGELWPELFKVPDEEWEKHVQPDMRGKVLCRKCYDLIKKWTDKGG